MVASSCVLNIVYMYPSENIQLLPTITTTNYHQQVSQMQYYLLLSLISILDLGLF